MKTFAASLLLLLAHAATLFAQSSAAPADEKATEKSASSQRPALIVVVGAEGADEYAPQFRQWAERWQSAAQKAQAACKMIGLEPASEATDRALLEQALAAPAEYAGQPLWLVLIGHGTFDGKVARFNLRGPDIAATELAACLKDIRRPLAVIDCASSSGPFVSELSDEGRVVIAATKSGHEYNFSRFGDYLSRAIADPAADLDKDQQTSLLEAFLLASAQVREFYAADSRLMTEHAILDDNGDKMGTPADFFQGLRVVKSAQSGARLDGDHARLFVLVPSDADAQLSPETRARRDELELKLAEIRRQKSQLPEAEYFALLEPLLIEIARLYQSPAR